MRSGTTISYRDWSAPESLKEPLRAGWGERAFLEPASEDPARPTAGPRDDAWGEKATFALEERAEGALRGVEVT